MALEYKRVSYALNNQYRQCVHNSISPNSFTTIHKCTTSSRQRRHLGIVTPHTCRLQTLALCSTVMLTYIATSVLCACVYPRSHSTSSASPQHLQNCASILPECLGLVRPKIPYGHADSIICPERETRSTLRKIVVLLLS